MKRSERDPGSAAILVEGLSFSYDGESVLEDVNLSVAANDLVAVVGPNGGGKTTLIKLMLGLLTPQRGSVTVLGREPAKVRYRLGYLPQHAHMDPHFPVTVMEVVLMGRLGNRAVGYNSEDRDAAQLALKRVELGPLAAKPFSALSGGQRQRVLLARALASNPDILLLDEPTANVDPAAGWEIYELLHALKDQITVVVVSHDLGFVSPYVGHVVCVNRRVVTHPTRDVTGEIISEVYGHAVHMVRHDHQGPPEGFTCG